MGSSSNHQRKPPYHQNQRNFRQRSLSPDHPPPSKPRLSPPDKPSTSTRRADFQEGTAGRVYSTCAICLGCHPHKIVECNSTMLWDNSFPSLATHSNKLLTMWDGSKFVCTDWQCTSSCSTSRHDSRHFCSGCASPSHGAQEFPRAQKVLSTHSL